MVTLFSTSCEDILNKTPDNRAELNTPAQISELLVSAYSSGNYALLGELSSDNFIDNNSPDNQGNYYNLGEFNKIHNEMFAWDDVVSSDEQDSPSSIWSGCYLAIAVDNHALQAITKLEAEGRADEVKSQKGEALLSRAYHHFILVNIFAQAYRNSELSKNDLGIPYITEPETTVSVQYERSTVAAVYSNIEKDLTEGIALIDDKNYEIPKYHFNKRAAHAFAARFYLFKRDYSKVVSHANTALGDNAAIYLRNWNADYPTFDAFSYGWINAESMNNFLLMPTSSFFNRVFGTRYGCNRDAADGTIFGTGPTLQGYSFAPCYDGRLYIGGSQEYGLYFPKSGEFFEYTDKIAGIGYGHVVRAEFTGEETLLCRAEAYVYLNQISNAVADLKAFDDSRKMTGFKQADLTASIINSFYTANKPLYVKTYNTALMSPDFIVSATQKPYIDCVLHFRRLETIFDGMRWFDIKRYGIEITHNIGSKSRTEKLTWDDKRRAIQIPQEVIAAGFQPNRLTNITSPIFTKLTVSCIKK
jgi:hypothetical protein